MDKSQQAAVDAKLENELKARRCLAEIQDVLERHGCVLLPSITFVGERQQAGLVCRVKQAPAGNNSSQKETKVPEPTDNSNLQKKTIVSNDGEAG